MKSTIYFPSDNRTTWKPSSQTKSRITSCMMQAGAAVETLHCLQQITKVSWHDDHSQENLLKEKKQVVQTQKFSGLDLDKLQCWWQPKCVPFEKVIPENKWETIMTTTHVKISKARLMRHNHGQQQITGALKEGSQFQLRENEWM